ncbi:MAG: hypothetical protein OXH83_02470 [Bryobacterales bacterium]|nr:hypothetical protein [Bryobacterales bacterium]
MSDHVKPDDFRHLSHEAVDAMMRLALLLALAAVGCSPAEGPTGAGADGMTPAEVQALGERAASNSMVAQFVEFTNVPHDVTSEYLYITVNAGATILFDSWGCDQQRELMAHLFMKWQEQQPTASMVVLKSYTGRRIGHYKDWGGERFHCN